MKFPRQTLRLISVRTADKDGKSYSFVKLANEATFESNDFMLGRETDVKGLTVQTRYDAELDIDGRFTSINLYPASEQSIATSHVKPDAKAS